MKIKGFVMGNREIDFSFNGFYGKTMGKKSDLDKNHTQNFFRENSTC